MNMNNFGGGVLMNFKIIKLKNFLNNISNFSIPLLLIFSAIMISSFSKYYMRLDIDAYKTVTSQVCRFEGDQFQNASINSAEPKILFGIKNYDDSNIYTNNNITYSINISSNNLDVTNSLNISPVFNNNMRELSGGDKSEDVITITNFPSNASNEEYNVTISMLSPYTKTLSATYTVTHMPDIESSEDDATSNPPYVIRTIKTNDFSGTKSYHIEWDTQKIFPDSTDPYIGHLSGGSGNIDLLPNMLYKLRFIGIY